MARVQTSIEHNGIRVPIEVHLEQRKTLRAAFGKNKVIVRIPRSLPQEEQRREYETAKKWIAKTLNKKPELLNQFIFKSYDNTIIVVMGDEYTITLEETNLKSCRGKLSNKKICLSIPAAWDSSVSSEMSKKTLAKLFGKAYQQQISEEVQSLNLLHFNRDINTIKLKYNKSNWGSCSSNKNINLSTRLLLAPAKVREYVIIHELAHLKEMNHSPRFWKIVEEACPEYKQHEKWLTKNGPSIDF